MRMGEDKREAVPSISTGSLGLRYSAWYWWLAQGANC